MIHVEVVQNEWATARQRVVARVLLNGRELRVESDGGHWEAVALQPFVDPESGMQVSPHSDPERFLRALHHHLKGDYLFATEAHEEGDCDFPVGEKVPMKVTDVSVTQGRESEAIA